MSDPVQPKKNCFKNTVKCGRKSASVSWDETLGVGCVHAEVVGGQGTQSSESSQPAEAGLGDSVLGQGQDHTAPRCEARRSSAASKVEKRGEGPEHCSECGGRRSVPHACALPATQKHLAHFSQ